MKNLPTFELFASYTCENEETLAQHAEAVARVFGLDPDDKPEEAGN